MSQDDIDRLVAERSLARAEFDDEDVAAFWHKAAASYGDAHIPGISTDGAFQRAYTAALQATITVLSRARATGKKHDEPLYRVLCASEAGG